MGTRWEEWRAQATAFDSGGLRIAGYDLGDAGVTPFTFLHGYPSASVDISAVLERLGAGHRLLTVDFPGFGASAKPVGHHHSIHGAADAVEALWAERGTTQTLLVAHDYGVSVGQELLARRAEGGLAV